MKVGAISGINNYSTKSIKQRKVREQQPPVTEPQQQSFKGSSMQGGIAAAKTVMETTSTSSIGVFGLLALAIGAIIAGAKMADESIKETMTDEQRDDFTDYLIRSSAMMG